MKTNVESSYKVLLGSYNLVALKQAISIVPPITEKWSLKKLILSNLVPFVLKMKMGDIFNFLSLNYFGRLSFLKS